MQLFSTVLKLYHLDYYTLLIFLPNLPCLVNSVKQKRVLHTTFIFILTMLLRGNESIMFYVLLDMPWLREAARTWLCFGFDMALTSIWYLPTQKELIAAKSAGPTSWRIFTIYPSEASQILFIDHPLEKAFIKPAYWVA